MKKVVQNEEDTNVKGKKKGKNDKNKNTPRTVQELIPFMKAFDNGIFQIAPKDFSKVYKINDMNFVTEPEDKQEDLLVRYQKILNKFPTNVTLSLVIYNKVNTDSDLASAYHLRRKDCRQDIYCDDYNTIIDAKIKEGRNDITKDKYVVLNINAPDFNTAEGLFVTMENELNEGFKNLTKQNPKPLTLYERVKLLNMIYNGNNEGMPFEKQFKKYIYNASLDSEKEELDFDLKKLKASGTTMKDLIAPEVLMKEKTHIRIGEERYVKTLSLADLPQNLDVKFLTEMSNIPSEMITTITFNSIPKKKAVNLIKYQNVSIKADLQKQSKSALREGIPLEFALDEDLQLAQVQAQTLRNDVFNEGKKIFYVNIYSTLIARDEEEMKATIDTYKMKCEDFSMKPNTLLGQQVKGLQSSLLMGKALISHDRMLTSESCCALFPFNIQEIQDKGGHFYGINSISKNMIMYDRKRSKLANGLIFGQSGSGKSFITKGEVIPNLLDGDDEMIILDPENEYRVIADAFDGNVIDLKPKSNYHINPCDLDLEWNEEDASPLTEKCDYMVGLVESILGKGRECNSFETNVIHRATNRMYEEYIRTMEDRREQTGGNCSSIDTDLCPTLVNFYEQLIADNSPEGNKVAMSIEPYCVGNYNLFAHHTNIGNQNAKITVYNLLYLPEKMKEMAMKVCLSSIWNKIVKNREMNDKMGLSKAIWVYLDEFHLFFQTESSATTIMAYFKRVRKYNGIMTGITQDVADLLNTRQGTAMFNNTGFFIFLNQSSKGRQYIQELFDVSDALIDNIKDKPSGVGLIYNGTSIVPFNYRLSTDTNLYKIMSTNPNDKKKQISDEDKAKQMEEAFGSSNDEELVTSDNE